MSVIVKGKNPRKPHTVRFWVDGRQRERSFATAKEARDFQIKTDHDTRAKIFVDDRAGREKFADAASAWIERSANCAGTKTIYRSVLSAHILPAIGSHSLASLANNREAVAQLLTVTMAHLSYSRRKQARLIITGVMDEAVIAGKIAAHRLGGIELANRGTKKDLSDFVFPAHGQLAQMAEGLNGLGLTVWLMRGCGLRISEALAVQKSCFRDGGKTLRIFEQVTPDGTGTAPLKHRRAGEYRDIPVPAYLWEMVRGLPDGYLFRRSGGRFPVYMTYLNAFKREARSAGIAARFTPHSLRHAFVSALLARDVPITDVARWVGHRDISVTFTVYGHLIPSAAARAASVLDDEYAAWSGVPLLRAA